MPWDAAKLARHILAMSNLADGGFIVVGVEDGTFARLGLNEDLAGTYDEEVMRDQMAKFADPHVTFAVERVADANGVSFLVIHVASFDEVPVVCRIDSTDTTAGAVYYRSSRRRPESAQINNSYDMRDVLTLAAVRMRQRLGRLGVRMEPTDDAVQEQLDRETADL
jgi:predicted HTH transcriptional regulator